MKDGNMIYLYAFLLGIIGGFCAFSQGAFFKKLRGQLVITLIFISEIAMAIYAQIEGYSGIRVIIISIFVGGGVGRVLYYYIRNGGKYNFLPSMPDELRIAQNYFIKKSETEFSFNSFADFMEISENEEILIDKYVNYCFNNMVNDICKKFNLTPENLKEIYHKLTAMGAGQAVNGHYVALSVITFCTPLEFYIKAQKSEKISSLEIVNILLDYFEGKCSAEDLEKLCSNSI